MNNARKVVPSVEEIVEKELGKDDNTEKEPVFDAVEDTITISQKTFDDLIERLTRAERPLRVKAKDALVANKRKVILVSATAASLGLAAFAVTHRDLLAEKLEETAEVVAEKTENTANEVKKDAREARTGSRTK